VYRPKFRAAQRYARQQGWRFRLVTERHMRTPYLENAKFLRPYRTLPMHEHHQRQLCSTRCVVCERRTLPRWWQPLLRIDGSKRRYWQCYGSWLSPDKSMPI
jgi:hypothetical protein